MMPGYQPRASAVISALFGVPITAGTFQQCPLHERPANTLYVVVGDFGACCIWRHCMLHSRHGLFVADILQRWLSAAVGDSGGSRTDRVRELVEDLTDDSWNDFWEDIWGELKSELKDDAEDDEDEGVQR